jgi:hypothetical protein
MAEFGQEHEIEIEVCKTDGYCQELEIFAQDNLKHGLPLTGFSKRRIADEMLKEGFQLDYVSKIFNLPEVAIEKWGQRNIIVKQGKKYVPMPAKNGVPEGAKATTEQYQQHKKLDYGISMANICRQIIRWINNDWIHLNHNECSELRELAELLKSKGF